MTSKHTQLNLESSMLSHLAFHARTSVQRAEAKASRKKPDQVYFTNSSESYAWYDPNTSSWKTWQRSLITDWELFSESFPKQGTMQNGQLYLQVHWEPVTSDQGGSVLQSIENLPTPTTMDHLPQRSPEALKRQMEGPRKGRTKLANLREAVNPETQKLFNSMLPTPTVCNDSMYYDKSPKKDKRHSKGLATELMDLQMLPTPRTRDYKGHQKEGYLERGYGPTLPDIIRQLPTPSANEHKYSMSKEDHQSGTCLAAMARKDRLSAPTGKPMSLNPAFVEEMMGYPIGHTACEH